MQRPAGERFEPKALRSTEVREVAVGKHTLKERAIAYASGSDFCRIFAENMKNLYLLSMVLTADSDKAEQCFVTGLEDCANGNAVFKEWAQSWARRMVIRNAIRLVTPRPPEEEVSPRTLPTRSMEGLFGDAQRAIETEMSSLLDLEPFERFAFVMSVLERYSVQDCALLLNSTRQAVIAARSRAMQQLARSSAAAGQTLEKASKDRGSVVEMAVPMGLATTA